MKIKKNDKVKVIKGKDRGKTGKVLQAFPPLHKVAIEGLNILHKNAKSRKQDEKGQRIEFPNPLDVSKVMLVCPKCTKPSRVGYKKLEDGSKARSCKKCGQLVD